MRKGMLTIALVSALINGNSLAKQSTDFRCEMDEGKKDEMSSEHRRLRLEIKSGKVTTFFSSWALSSSDPSLRSGYAVTCERNLTRFLQTKDSKGIVLQYRPNQYEQDHANCKVQVVEEKNEIIISSESCSYECLQLDYNFEKNGEVCKVLR